jgi:hypothetical protein
MVMKQISYLLGGGYTETAKTQYKPKKDKVINKRIPSLCRKDQTDTPKKQSK